MKCPYCGQTPKFRLDVERYAQCYWEGGKAISDCCGNIIQFHPIKIHLSLTKTDPEITVDNWGQIKNDKSCN